MNHNPHPNRTYSHALFLYETHVMRGFAYKDHDGDTVFGQGYETQFVKVRRNLFYVSTRDNSFNICTKQVQNWAKRFHFEIEHAVFPSKVEDYKDNVLIKNLSFVHTVLCGLGLSNPLPLKEPVYSAVIATQQALAEPIKIQLKRYDSLPNRKEAISPAFIPAP